MSNPFDDFRLLDWITEEIMVPEDFPDRIALIGSGPFGQDQLAPLLQEFEVELVPPEDETAVVVLGTVDWHPNELERVILDRRGTKVRFYSQEMLISWILSGRDPFDSDEELLRRFGNRHPALNYLDSIGFDWPTTEAYGGGGGIAADWPNIGMLARMGYHVGRAAGIPGAQRRHILRQILLLEQLPSVVSPSYMAEWGQADSTQRLRKLANTLASLCRNERRRNPPPLVAIEQREADLAWLRKEFYDDRFDFRWPSSRLRGGHL